MRPSSTCVILFYTLWHLAISYPQNLLPVFPRILSSSIHPRCTENNNHNYGNYYPFNIMSDEIYNDTVWTFANETSSSCCFSSTTTSSNSPPPIAFPITALTFHMKQSIGKQAIHLDLKIGEDSDVDYLHIHGTLAPFDAEILSNYTSYKIRDIHIRKSPPLWRIFHNMSSMWKIMKLWNSIQKNGIHVYVRPQSHHCLWFLFSSKDPLRNKADQVHSMPWLIQRQTF